MDGGVNDTEKLWSQVNDINNAIDALQRALSLPFRPIAFASVTEVRDVLAKECQRVKDIEEANTFLRAEVVRLRDEMKANQT